MKQKASTYRPLNLNAWLRLIRWPNLLIVGGTQAVAWWCVIYPLPGLKVLTPLHFMWLCLSTVLIAAGGYIINDYFDIRIDIINKPDKVVLERDIPRRLAIIMHSALNAIALGLAAIVAFPAGHPEWLLLQLATTGLLWRYSTTWKRQFVTGNLVVALTTALTVGVLMLYEPALKQPWLSETGMPPDFAKWLLEIFMFFAFGLTWMREVVKDMEDYKGDDAEGCITMPIRWGLLKSSRFVQAAGLVIVLVLVGATVILWLAGSFVAAGYLLLCLETPLLLLIFSLPNGSTQAHYHQASTRIKMVMLSGIVSLIIFHLTNRV